MVIFSLIEFRLSCHVSFQLSCLIYVPKCCFVVHLCAAESYVEDDTAIKALRSSVCVEVAELAEPLMRHVKTERRRVLLCVRYGSDFVANIIKDLRLKIT